MTRLFESIQAARQFMYECLAGLTQSDPLFVLDSRGWEADSLSRYEWLIAWSDREALDISIDDPDPFGQMSDFYSKHQGEWMFVFLSYDLKNSLEKLPAPRPERISFGAARVVVPKFTITCRRHKEGYLVEGDIDAISDLTPPSGTFSCDSIEYINEAQYHRAFDRMQQHIQRGDIFEANLCMEFSADKAVIDPFHFFGLLGEASPSPFSCLLRKGEQFLLSASPERFIQGHNGLAVSQPMKGTARRSPDAAIDEQFRLSLLNSEKERAENIMIVDLVRNDLGRSAQDAAVWVEDLCKVLPYPGVWQMISTVCCNPRPGLSPFDIIKNAFPMGSMTGAPKVRAMEIIDELEGFARGLFSGSVGYINPSGEYDFNVIIRSLQYDRQTSKISFAAGGAITSGSEAEGEYRECLLKASTLASLLQRPFITFDE
jgi:para-aminobenzoate synthetase component I